MEFLDLLIHTDDYLTRQVEANLRMTYLIVFLIIFSESALITCPFLPGDGLLFSVGVVAASTELNFYFMTPMLIIAAFTGFIVNYRIGVWFGTLLLKKDIPILQRYYRKTHAFLEKYGVQSVLISRFFPILRTYLPFVAGVVRMDHGVFIKYSLLGAILWVVSFSTAGYLVGEIPWVRDNYGFIFLGLILLTLLPIIYAIN